MEKIVVEYGLDILEKYKQKFSLHSNKELAVHLDIPYQTVASWYRRKRVPSAEQKKIAAKIDPVWAINLDEIKNTKLLNTSENMKSLTSMYSIMHMEFLSNKLLISEMILELAIEFSHRFAFKPKTKIGTMLSDSIEDTWWLQELLFDVVFDNKNGDILEILSDPKIKSAISEQIYDLDKEVEITKVVIFLSTFFAKEERQKIIQGVCSILIPKEVYIRFYKQEFIPGRIKEYITLLLIDLRKHADPYKQSCLDHEINYLAEKYKFYYSKEMVNFNAHKYNFDVFL